MRPPQAQHRASFRLSANTAIWLTRPRPRAQVLCLPSACPASTAIRSALLVPTAPSGLKTSGFGRMSSAPLGLSRFGRAPALAGSRPNREQARQFSSSVSWSPSYASAHLRACFRILPATCLMLAAGCFQPLAFFRACVEVFKAAPSGASLSPYGTIERRFPSLLLAASLFWLPNAARLVGVPGVAAAGATQRALLSQAVGGYIPCFLPPSARATRRGGE